MFSNRSNYEVCECPDSSGRIEYACNCGNPAVFLCSACVVSHLSKPRSHLFISIEQARAMRNSDYHQLFTESFSKFMSLKSVLQNYEDNIATFITQVRACKPTLKTLIDQIFDVKISQLEGIRAEVSKKMDEVSRQMSCLDQTGQATLEKYAARGLEGIIPQYYDKFELREQDIRYAIMNSVLIYKSTESLNYLSYNDLAVNYRNLYEQNNELRSTLQIYIDQHNQKQEEEESKKKIKRRPQDLSYEESLEKFKITIKNNKIQYHDRVINKTIEYPIKLEDNSQISNARCCLSPSGDIFIVSYLLGLPAYETYCDTFKFSKENFTCIKLSNLNVRRSLTTTRERNSLEESSVGLCFNGEYLYAFGGGSASRIAERMKWASQGWVNLPNMHLDRFSCGCYSVNNFIIIYGQNSNRLEYFDVNALKFTLIEKFWFYTPSAIKRIDDLIYIMNLPVHNNISVAVFNDEMKLIQSNDSLKPNTLTCFGRSRRGEVETICFSYSDMKLKFHDVYDPDYAVIQEAKITLIEWILL